MMKSIKMKLILGILLILSIFLVGIFTYSITFKDYFQSEKLHEMESVIFTVENSIDNGYISKVSDIVKEMEDKYNIKIDVIIGDYNLPIEVLDSYSINKNDKNSITGNGIGGQNRTEVIENLGISNNVERKIIYDKYSNLSFLTSTKNNIEAGYNISVRIPINIMDDAVSKSLKLLMIIFIPITIVVLLLTLIFSNIFIKPILEIKRKTSNIQDLNFTEKLQVKGKDEIADLANSVNSLSDKIDTTLKDLNEKNLKLQELIQKEIENKIIRREFVSSVSHELKSPIAVISGYAQMLKERIITSKEDMNYYISVIDEEADRMQVIVNDLLDLYKLESNTFNLEVKDVDLESLVNKIIRKNSLRFQELNINSSIDKVTVLADYIRLEQAIQNYINNGLSHIDENKVLNINVTKVHCKVRISVYNSGQNIKEENLERIWQGFVRVDKVRNYKEKRVGLGLAIVKQITKLHNGNCGVINKDNGVEFWIDLDIIT